MSVAVKNGTFATAILCDKFVKCYFCVSGPQANVAMQPSWVTALSWAQTFTPYSIPCVASQPNASESLLVGRLDGTLCWLEVTEDLQVKSTELICCQRKEGELYFSHLFIRTFHAVKYTGSCKSVDFDVTFVCSMK